MHDNKPFLIDKSKVPKDVHMFMNMIEDSPILVTQKFVKAVLKNEITGIGFFDTSTGEDKAVYSIGENPIPEVESFTL